MSRPVELNKTWLPGPSRGTQTFNAPANLTIPYGRHKATISGRAGSGNNPGAQYSTNYNVNYNVQPLVGNQPEASRPATAYTTNYVQTYALGNPYATQYSIQYTTNYVAVYPGGYGVSYNVVDTQYTNVTYPAAYNVVDTQYTSPYSVAYNAPGNQPATAYSVAYSVTYSSGPPVPGNYNPPTGFNWDLIAIGPSYGGAAYLFDSGSNPFCPMPYEVFGDYFYYECFPFGNTQNFTPAYNTSYNTSYPESAWITNNNTAYNVAYNVAYNRNTPLTYNAAYAVAYNRSNPISYNSAFNIAYNVGNQPEVSRPINAYGVNYNSSYNIGTQPATAYSIVYSTNYNLAYPVGNTPAANYVINSYAPGVPGDPATVLGVYFPGGSVGNTAPYVSDTVVQYWDYPDYKTHPISVPPGGQIVVKLE